MELYKAIKEKPNSNTIVKELNARVLTSTFKNTEGVQLADLYTYSGTQCNNPMEIVAHGTCAPIMGIFVRTLNINF